MTKQINKVVIAVTGVQRDAAGEETRIELVTVGKYSRKNGTDYLLYDESEISGMEGTNTALKIYNSHVVLLRMGKIEQKQEFRLGEKTYGTYITPFGSIPMAALTSRLEITVSENGTLGAVYIEYDLELDGQWQSTNTLGIMIRED
ncbi:hypothetical protein P22_2586 [Propionispora sp. 2/2-37]|uniref:DUF1934 domain-containing protein n=1 Tax=Propionispora sp. 2/2-37 TaxID=1677858 RepID=UPI0006BB7B77|nr:DUF1934 domain-containing protein [Propionispora sp. 2/2-37]CUH96496.1 hypothetical protein P22_2586 [Propionispora sp. 2/2-37]